MMAGTEAERVIGVFCSCYGMLGELYSMKKAFKSTGKVESKASFIGAGVFLFVQ